MCLYITLLFDATGVFHILPCCKLICIIKHPYSRIQRKRNQAIGSVADRFNKYFCIDVHDHQTMQPM